MRASRAHAPAPASNPHIDSVPQSMVQCTRPEVEKGVWGERGNVTLLTFNRRLSLADPTTQETMLGKKCPTCRGLWEMQGGRIILKDINLILCQMCKTYFRTKELIAEHLSGTEYTITFLTPHFIRFQDEGPKATGGNVDKQARGRYDQW